MSEGRSRNSFEFQFYLHGGRNTCYFVGLFVYVSYSILKWKCVIWALVQHMTSDMTNKARSVSHTGHNTDGPPSVLRRASGKDSLFLLTWMSPQRRRRFRKLSSRIRKSFRAAKRWKSSFRVRRRSSTFRVSSMLPNILLCDGVSAELLLFSVSRVACEALKTCLFEVLLLVEAFLKRTILLLVVNSRTAVHMKNVALGRGIQLREQ